MTPQDFLNLATDINILRRNQAAQELEKFHAKRNLAFAEFDVLEGVDLAALGKNEEARKMEKLRLLREDDEWTRREFEVAEAERKLITINMELDCLYNIRRAGEAYLKALGVVGMESPTPADGDIPNLIMG